MSEIVTPEQVETWRLNIHEHAAQDDPRVWEICMLDLIKSHEALRAALAEAERQRDEAVDAAIAIVRQEWARDRMSGGTFQRIEEALRLLASTPSEDRQHVFDHGVTLDSNPPQRFCLRCRVYAEEGTRCPGAPKVRSSLFSRR